MDSVYITVQNRKRLTIFTETWFTTYSDIQKGMKLIPIDKMTVPTFVQAMNWSVDNIHAVTIF